MLSCSSNKDNIKDGSTNKDFENVLLIPDSLQTPDQKKLIKDLSIVAYENLIIEDNHMKFILTKDEFVKKGFSEEYYDLIQKNIKDNNHFTDSLGVNITEDFNKTKKEILELLKQMTD